MTQAELKATAPICADGIKAYLRDEIQDFIGETIMSKNGSLWTIKAVDADDTHRPICAKLNGFDKEHKDDCTAWHPVSFFPQIEAVIFEK